MCIELVMISRSPRMSAFRSPCSMFCSDIPITRRTELHVLSNRPAHSGPRPGRWSRTPGSVAGGLPVEPRGGVTIEAAARQRASACRNHGVIATCKPASMPAIAHSLAAMPGAAKPARARGRARAWPGSRRRCREPPARREAPGADDAAALKPCSLPGASLRHACRNPVRASRLLSNHDIYRIFSNSGVKSWHDSSVVRHFMPLPRRLFAVWPSPGPVLASGPCRYVVPRKY